MNNQQAFLIQSVREIRHQISEINSRMETLLGVMTEISKQVGIKIHPATGFEMIEFIQRHEANLRDRGIIE